nr:MAG TPA: hypothetical protein [Herelleviridae sp.]
MDFAGCGITDKNFTTVAVILPLLTTIFVIYFCTHNESIDREIRGFENDKGRCNTVR